MSGESGGTCRPNVDLVNNHCDHVAEREGTQPYGYRVVPYRVGTTAKCMSIGKSTFLKIALSFPSLIPCLIPPTDDRLTTERTPTQLLAYKM